MAPDLGLLPLFAHHIEHQTKIQQDRTKRKELPVCALLRHTALGRCAVTVRRLFLLSAVDRGGWPGLLPIIK